MSREPESAGGRQLPLPSLGLDTAQLGNLFRAISDEEAASTVDAVWRAGIRYFDTAPQTGRPSTSTGGQPRSVRFTCSCRP